MLPDTDSIRLPNLVRKFLPFATIVSSQFLSSTSSYFWRTDRPTDRQTDRQTDRPRY